MLQQRLSVNSQIRENELRNYFYFGEIFLGRSMIPVALAGLVLGILMIAGGGTGPIVGSVFLLAVAAYGISFPLRCNKFMARNGHEVGRQNRVTIDKRSGVVVEERTLHNIEEYSWPQISTTAESKKMFVFILPYAACYLPKSDMTQEEADFLSRVCIAKKGSKHKKNF